MGSQAVSTAVLAGIQYANAMTRKIILDVEDSLSQECRVDTLFFVEPNTETTGDGIKGYREVVYSRSIVVSVPGLDYVIYYYGSASWPAH